MGRHPRLRFPHFTIRLKSSGSGNSSGNSTTVEKEDMESTIIRSDFHCDENDVVLTPHSLRGPSDPSSEDYSMISSCASSLATEGELDDVDLKCPSLQDLHILDDQGSVDHHPDDASGSSLHKHVRFGSAQSRVYPQVLGDHPYCAEGCSLELDWEFTCQEECPAEAGGTYQKLCPRLTPEERLAIIQPKYSDQSIRKACRRRCTQDGIIGKRQQKRQQQEFFGSDCK